MTNPEKWADKGPNSQGKILTHLLRGEAVRARELVSGWGYGDLIALRNAASALYGMADRELNGRDRADGLA